MIKNKLWNTLTEREQEAAVLVAQGYSREEGGEAMEVAVKTFDHHRLRVLHKLDLANSVALVWFCLKHKVLSVNARAI